VLFFFRYVDAVLTIPKGTLFPMCGMNLAFDRELIGPAMYFGLMGDGQPIGRYDDMWAGWCMKVPSHSPLILPTLLIVCLLVSDLFLIFSSVSLPCTFEKLRNN
jgi:hypothetical protein